MHSKIGKSISSTAKPIKHEKSTNLVIKRAGKENTANHVVNVNNNKKIPTDWGRNRKDDTKAKLVWEKSE